MSKLPHIERVNLYESVGRLIRFFERSSLGGVVFAVVETESLIPEIAELVRARLMDEEGKRLSSYRIRLESDRPFLAQIEEEFSSSPRPDGLMLINLDEVIRETKGEILYEINRVRESWLAFELPICFWVSAKNLNEIIRKAHDSWDVRTRAAIWVDIPDYLLESRGPDRQQQVKIEFLEQQMRLLEQGDTPSSPEIRTVLQQLAEAYRLSGQKQKLLTLQRHPSYPLITPPDSTGYQYDVFLSYASEDRVYAAQLAGALQRSRLRVWFDQFEMKLGDSIAKQINQGLAESQYGIILISPRYLEKQWTTAELNTLFMQETQSGRKRILPLWHHISLDEILGNYPLLADKIGLSTQDRSLEDIVSQILDVVRGQRSPVPNELPPEDFSNVATRSIARGEVDKDQIRRLIGQGNIGKAMEALVTWGKQQNDPDLSNTILLLASQFNGLKKELLKGTILHRDANITQNRIIHAILNVLEY